MNLQNFVNGEKDELVLLGFYDKYANISMKIIARNHYILYKILKKLSCQEVTN